MSTASRLGEARFSAVMKEGAKIENLTLKFGLLAKMHHRHQRKAAGYNTSPGILVLQQDMRQIHTHPLHAPLPCDHLDHLPRDGNDLRRARVPGPPPPHEQPTLV